MKKSSVSRRDVLMWGTSLALGVGVGLTPAWAQQPRRVLLFTKSSGFEHDVIKRQGDAPSVVGRALVRIAKQFDVEMEESKDGTLFEPGSIGRYDGFVFYTSGNLTEPGTDKHPPMSERGKGALLDAIRSGRGFLGLHSASDTFRGGKEIDPYVEMLGAEFVSHGTIQDATMRVADDTFPGAGVLGEVALREEWYAMTRYAKDLKPILMLQTRGMQGPMYKQDPYPVAWSRQHGKGRVAYISPGHLRETWENEMYLKFVSGALGWTMGV